jgi:predicted ATPase
MIFSIDHLGGRRVPSYPHHLVAREREEPVVVLKRDDWNDYGYRTSCDVFVYITPDSPVVSLGSLRIMVRDQPRARWVFEDESRDYFRSLGHGYCSLGKRLGFYRNLQGLGTEFARTFLVALRDAAFDQDIWNAFAGDVLFEDSLLRDKSEAIEIRDAVPTLFGIAHQFVDHFRYSVQLPGPGTQHRISFDFVKRGHLPHRVMLLVGPNGTGKTQLLANLAIALTGVTRDETGEQSEQKAVSGLTKRRRAGTIEPLPSIYQVLALSFNAFDKFEIPRLHPDAQIRYTYNGIRGLDGSVLSEDGLLVAIREALDKMGSERRAVLLSTLQRVLGPETASGLLTESAERVTTSNSFYEQRSAGQRIVLNILTHLVANLRERSLVLLDEPETHLHPSLSTTLISEILRLLDQFTSFAVIATHSPIIAQQVPSDHIRVLRRVEDGVEIGTPRIECFGENLSEISNVLFETREFERDYTSVIDLLLRVNDNDPDRVEALFPRGLGSNARTYLRSMVGNGL